MTKEDFMSRIGKGPMEYKDFGKIKIWTQPSETFPDQIFVHGKVISESPFARDAGFGGCFMSTIEEGDYAKLDDLFASVRQKMQRADALGKADPIELKKVRYGITGGTFYRAGDKTLNLENYQREEEGIDWFYLYVVYQGENDYSYGRPVILDGALYRPIYSFWLEHSYYDRNHPNGMTREK